MEKSRECRKLVEVQTQIASRGSGFAGRSVGLSFVGWAICIANQRRNTFYLRSQRSARRQGMGAKPVLKENGAKPKSGPDGCHAPLGRLAAPTAAFAVLRFRFQVLFSGLFGVVVLCKAEACRILTAVAIVNIAIAERASSPPNGCGGIRTPGGLSPTAVFKTAALDHSATHPNHLSQKRRRWSAMPTTGARTILPTHCSAAKGGHRAKGRNVNSCNGLRGDEKTAAYHPYPWRPLAGSSGFGGQVGPCGLGTADRPSHTIVSTELHFIVEVSGSQPLLQPLLPD